MDRKHTCPQRTDTLQDQDTWNSRRWSKGWVWGETPRACSYCGCINPEDAERLIADGWRTDRTDKYYKLYLYPPGHLGATTELLTNIRGGVDPVEAVKHYPKEPSPMVKAYIWHFDKEVWEKIS